MNKVFTLNKTKFEGYVWGTRLGMDSPKRDTMVQHPQSDAFAGGGLGTQLEKL
jgi:hypothetical protein